MPDALAHTFDFEDASRNIRKSAYQPRDASRSATKDQAEDASLAGPRALGARPRTCRISPSLRVTLHASLPRARANKEGFEARASIELPEDGSPAQLHMSALELEAELRDFWRKEFKEVRYVGNDTFVVAYTLRL